VRVEPDRGEGTDGEPILVRSLTREYRIFAPTRARHLLSYLEAAPDMPGHALAPVDFRVKPSFDFLRLDVENEPPLEGSEVTIINKLYRLIGFGISEEAPGAPMIHGASFVSPEGRLVLIGDKGAGKTTLSLHLASQGYALEGDEHVVVERDHVVTRPRNLRVKDSALSFFPALQDTIRAAPGLPAESGAFVYSVSPRRLGQDWSIVKSRVSDLVFIEANHGGRSVMSPVPRDAAFQRLLKSVVMPDIGKMPAIARLHAVVGGARLWRLSLGDLTGAERHLARLLDTRKAVATG
jgi:hypothetical protein